MARKQLNIRLDDLTLAAIKRIAAEHNMSESQVVTRAVFLLEQGLKPDEPDDPASVEAYKASPRTPGRPKRDS
jgi:hypothetical protein